MDFLSRLAESDLFVSVAVVAVPWALARAFAWWKAEVARRRGERYAGAVEALEIGVQEAWERLGRAWKRSRADGGPQTAALPAQHTPRRYPLRLVRRDDPPAPEEGDGSADRDGASGKLTDDQRERLRECALAVASQVGLEKGLDVLETVGRQAVNALIRKIVAKRKSGRG